MKELPGFVEGVLTMAHMAVRQTRPEHSKLRGGALLDDCNRKPQPEAYKPLEPREGEPTQTNKAKQSQIVRNGP